MKTRIVLIGMVVLGWAACAQATTIVYDAADQFSTTNNNPNGAWTYGHCTGVSLATFTAYDTPQTDAPVAGLVDWTYSGGGYIAYNPTGSDISTSPGWGGTTWATHKITARPAASGSQAVIRWTAPEAGTVDVSALCTSVQEYYGSLQSSAWYVFHNNTYLAGQNTTDGISVTATAMPVANGDTLTFVLDTGTGHPDTTAGWTIAAQVQATVTLTTVPEPSSVALLSAGLLGLLAYAWRKRK